MRSIISPLRKNSAQVRRIAQGLVGAPEWTRKGGHSWCEAPCGRCVPRQTRRVPLRVGARSHPEVVDQRLGSGAEFAAHQLTQRFAQRPVLGIEQCVEARSYLTLDGVDQGDRARFEFDVDAVADCLVAEARQA